MTAPGLRRDELIACGALLVTFVLLRILAAPGLAFDLLDPEELLNLRLTRQVAAGHEVGELGRYWYTGVGGNTGAGSLVLSVLYLPLTWFVEADIGAVRTMGALWGIGGALLLAGIGRELLGRGGAAAGLSAAVAMPPTWVAWTLTAYGNYIGGVVVTLLSTWLLLRCVRVDREEPWAVALGWSLVFGPWYCVSAAPPAVLLLVVAVVGLRKRPAALAALASGLILGATPVLVGLAPTTEVPSPVGGTDLQEVVGSVLSDPLSWPRVFFRSLSAMPLLDYRDTTGEDWAFGWQMLIDGPLRLVAWLGVFGLAAWAIRGEKLGLPQLAGPTRAVLGVLALCAIAIPPGLSAIGVGPEDLDIEQLYFYDPRRAAVVYPVMAVGLAAAGWRLWPHRVGKAVVVVWMLLSVASAASMAMNGAPPPQPIHPVRYMLCPAEQPADRSSVCVDSLWEDQVAVLEALVLRDDLQDVGPLRAALQGFGSVARDEDLCEPSGGLTDEPQASFGLGAAVSTACPERIDEACGAAPDPGACREGADWAAGYRN